MPQTHQMIFVNLPVADVARSRAFFEAIGYEIDERISNETAIGVKFSDTAYAMLLQADFFATFHDGVAADGQREVLTCLSAESRDEVDAIAERAVAAGGREIHPKDAPPQAEDTDFMYGRTLEDLDGHVWEILWMDMDAAQAAGALG